MEVLVSPPFTDRAADVEADTKESEEASEVEENRAGEETGGRREVLEDTHD